MTQRRDLPPAESHPGPVCVALELDRFSEPISGRLGVGDGPLLPFSGWLELVTRLEDLADDWHPA